MEGSLHVEVDQVWAEKRGAKVRVTKGGDKCILGKALSVCNPIGGDRR